MSSTNNQASKLGWVETRINVYQFTGVVENTNTALIEALKARFEAGNYKVEMRHNNHVIEAPVPVTIVR